MRTIQDLYQMQGLPLNLKISLTKSRIRDWINAYGEDGVYVSFSGGKDSTVLLHLVREEYPNVKAVFVDTGLEYPEIRQYVKTFDNVTWLKPKKNFRKVIEDYGYPIVSKEVSERVYYAQKYLKWYREQNTLDRPTEYGLADLCVLRMHDPNTKARTWANVPEAVFHELIKTQDKGMFKIRELLGESTDKNGNESMFNYSKWLFLSAAPFAISNKCCDVMKKAPIHSYHKKTGRMAITAQMASESRRRTITWLKNGCNGFNMKYPLSNPMSFWTEQDVLLYIYQTKLPICSVYGEVVKDQGAIDGQIDMEDYFGKELFNLERPLLKTTGCSRTGCMFCGFGCHLEKPGEGRFERMKVTHPKQYDYIMRPWEQGGLNYKEVIDWINEHGNMDIRY